VSSIARRIPPRSWCLPGTAGCPGVVLLRAGPAHVPSRYACWRSWTGLVRLGLAGPSRGRAASAVMVVASPPLWFRLGRRRCEVHGRASGAWRAVSSWAAAAFYHGFGQGERVGDRCSVLVAQVDFTDRALRPGDRPLARRLLPAPVALADLNNLLRHDRQAIRAPTWHKAPRLRAERQVQQLRADHADPDVWEVCGPPTLAILCP